MQTRSIIYRNKLYSKIDIELHLFLKQVRRNKELSDQQKNNITSIAFSNSLAYKLFYQMKFNKHNALFSQLECSKEASLLISSQANCRFLGFQLSLLPELFSVNQNVFSRFNKTSFVQQYKPLFLNEKDKQESKKLIEFITRIKLKEIDISVRELNSLIEQYLIDESSKEVYNKKYILTNFRFFMKPEDYGIY